MSSVIQVSFRILLLGDYFGKEVKNPLLQVVVTTQNSAPSYQVLLVRWKRGITLSFVFSISMVKVNVKDNDTNRDPRWVNETTTIKTLKAQQFSVRHAVKNPRDTFTGSPTDRTRRMARSNHEWGIAFTRSSSLLT